MIKVSVIIPAYNAEGVIGDCLESLSKQTYRDMEVIVVDDGSNDNSKLKVQKSKLQFKNLKLLMQKHSGPGEARNLGARHATGEILVFVDADMTFDKDFIKILLAPIISGKSRGTFSWDEYVSNPENVWSQCWGINEGWEKGRRHPKIRQPAQSRTQKVFRAILKSEFDKVSGFSAGGYYTDDWSLSEKLGYEAIVASGAKFYHKNPQTLGEVFNQAKWVAKRPYKLGMLGMLIAFSRTSLLVSLMMGIVKSLFHLMPQFLIFKVVYDFGAFLGILEYMILGRGAK